MTISGITVPGTAGGSILTVTTGTGDYLKLAQQMASALNSASVGSSLSVSTITSGSTVPFAPTIKATSELGIVGAGGSANHAEGTGWSYIVNVTSSPDSVVASNTRVLSGDQGATIIVSGTSSVAATGGNNFVNATGNYLLSTATGNDTIYASGTGTVAAGAGSNFVSVSGTGNFVISAGNADTIRQGIGPVSVNALGTNSTISGSTNAADTMTVTLGGSSNTLFAQQTQASVTITGGATSAGSGNFVQGGFTSAGNLTVLDTADFATIVANADSVVSATVTGNSTQVFGGSGTLNLVALGANDVLSAGTGTANVSLTGSSATLYGNVGGTGTLNAFISSNTSKTFLLAEGTSNVTLTGASSLLVAGSGTAHISVGGADDTVFAGTGPETVTTSTNPVVFGTAGGNLQFIGGAGIPTVIGGKGGSVNATVGAGGLNFNAGVSNNSTITSGIGQATIFGGDGSVVNFIGTAPGGAQFHAYGGNETLTGSGSTTNNLYFGSTVAGSTTNLIGGSGSDYLVAGANSETMTSGSGNDIFVFFNSNTKLGAANVTITDFDTAGDAVYILGYDSTKSAANLLGSGSVGASGVTLTLSDKTSITFSNLTDITQLYGKILYG